MSLANVIRRIRYRLRPPPPLACCDCGIEVAPDECGPGTWSTYMVNGDIWEQTGLSWLGGMLCVPCLEQRIGRALTFEDLSDSSLNDPDEVDEPRLRALKERRIAASAK